MMALKTEIKHKAGTVSWDGNRYLVGKEMSAKLWHADPVVGTATGPNWTWMYGLWKKFKPAGPVRGHLLNHDLGGFAEPNNLYPISTKANADHSELVEQKVKALLAKQREEADNGRLADRVVYEVDVDEKSGIDTPSPVAEFKCKWGLEHDHQRYGEVVKSNLKTDTGGFRGSGAVQVPPDWKHVRVVGRKKEVGKGSTNRVGLEQADYPDVGVDVPAVPGGVTENQLVKYHNLMLPPEAVEVALSLIHLKMPKGGLMPRPKKSWTADQLNDWSALMKALGYGKQEPSVQASAVAVKQLIGVAGDMGTWGGEPEVIDALWDGELDEFALESVMRAAVE